VRATLAKPVNVDGRWPRHRYRFLAVEVMTAVLALAGGILLVVAPDGSLLQADPAALAGSPFSTWRVPGLLLAVLVGGGYALAAVMTAAHWRWARPLAGIAGAGLVAFEAFEMAWLGPQPLELLFAAVGAYVLQSAICSVRAAHR
jgi:hypothetical protein